MPLIPALVRLAAGESRILLYYISSCMPAWTSSLKQIKFREWRLRGGGWPCICSSSVSVSQGVADIRHVPLGLRHFLEVEFGLFSILTDRLHYITISLLNTSLTTMHLNLRICMCHYAWAPLNFYLRTQFVYSFSLFYVICMCVYLNTSVCDACVDVPKEAKKWASIPWNWSYKTCKAYDMCTGSWTQVVCRNNKWC